MTKIELEFILLLGDLKEQLFSEIFIKNKVSPAKSLLKMTKRSIHGDIKSKDDIDPLIIEEVRSMSKDICSKSDKDFYVLLYSITNITVEIFDLPYELDPEFKNILINDNIKFLPLTHILNPEELDNKMSFSNFITKDLFEMEKNFKFEVETDDDGLVIDIQKPL